jgi:hypothetical protein
MALVLLALMAALPCAAPPCTCIELPPVRAVADAEVVLDRARAIFVGRVVHVEPRLRSVPGNSGRTSHFREVRARLRVQRQFAGPKMKTLTVISGAGGGDCGVGFEKGRSYLVYVLPDAQQDGETYVSICDGTKPVSEAAAELDLLQRAADDRRRKAPQ